MDLGNYTLNQKAEEEGVPVKIDGTTFTLGRVGSPRYRAAMQRILKKHAVAIRSMQTSPDLDKMDLITAEVMAEAVVLGWDVLTINGEEIPFSKETALKLLADPRLRVFRQMLEEHAENHGMFFEEAIQDATKNL